MKWLKKIQNKSDIDKRFFSFIIASIFTFIILVIWGNNVFYSQKIKTQNTIEEISKNSSMMELGNFLTEEINKITNQQQENTAITDLLSDDLSLEIIYLLMDEYYENEYSDYSFEQIDIFLQQMIAEEYINQNQYDNFIKEFEEIYNNSIIAEEVYSTSTIKLENIPEETNSTSTINLNETNNINKNTEDDLEDEQNSDIIDVQPLRQN